MIDLEVEIDYGQVYIYSVAPWRDDSTSDAVLRALDDARQSGRWVGVVDGLIDVVVPFRKSFDAPMRVEVWSEEPPLDNDAWDHVVDADFDVCDGELVFEPSGGFTPVRCPESVPSGRYRARVSGRGYAEAAEGAVGVDSYRLRLWPRENERPPELRKSWPGWQRLG
ncbi:hypothetical protein [Goodfellowiella coeruleoviolacea]|uniref:hypothetical protein n=1 Tax=Goodfellowiella coeruleoviolacea TaxID=334858 RepID=UPI0020A48750|nr:hypothetical protein [Goodfellowiella coeruleoviolacea]